MSRTETDIVELRILSGPHLGATAGLGPGRHIFGSDDLCDFILADGSVAPRHLALTVSEDEGVIKVAARPLEAEVAFKAGVLPSAGAEVEPGEPLGLGFSALAWRPAGEDWSPVTLVPQEYQVSPGSKEAVPDPDPEAAAPKPDEAEAGEDSGQETTVAAAAAGRKRRPPMFWVGLAVLLLLLAPLFYSQWRPVGTGADKVGRIRSLLEANDFQGLTVESGGDAVVISGPLPDDREVARLVALVRGQPLKVYLKVAVANDRIRAVQDALNAHGFYPEVDFDDAGISVAAYMKDGLVEARAFGYVDNDVRDAVVSRRHIVYQDQLEAVLRAELKRAGLPELQMTLADGHVDFPVELNIESRRNLDQAVSAAGGQLGIPVYYRIVSPDGAVLPSLSGKLEPREAAGADVPPPVPVPASPWSGLRVTGVTMSPLKFVSTSDGQKLFEGSVLRSGYTIEKILSDEIILSRDGRIINYKLGD